jgi:hypothetical protein
MKTAAFLFALLTACSVFGQEATTVETTIDTLASSFHSFHCSDNCPFAGNGPPEYPGGYPAFRHYLQENIREVHTTFSGTGKCYLSFYIAADGSVTDILIKRGVPNCPECDAEAVRVLKEMPKWKPAKSHNNAYRYEMHLPIAFNIN